MTRYPRVELCDVIGSRGIIEVEGVPRGVARHKHLLGSLVGQGGVFWKTVIHNGNKTLLARRARWRSPYIHKDTDYSVLLFASETGEPGVFQGRVFQDLEGNPVLDAIACKVGKYSTFGYRE